MTWSYGVVTVPHRSLPLAITLNSLAHAGFPLPHLFIDPGSDPLGVVGNSILALWSLYLRDPQASLYALFQDDILCRPNIRDYLTNTCRHPNVCYNLYTALDNEGIILNQPAGWHPATPHTGRGAQALVFPQKALQALLSSPLLVQKPQHARNPTTKFDGLVVEALNLAGYTEMIHNPSLVQHQPGPSTIGSTPHSARSFDPSCLET